MNIHEYDKRIHWFNMQLNILKWDRDFISPVEDEYKKNELINAIAIEKHKYIINNFGTVFEENSHAYRIFYKDYLYSVGLPDELENEISNAVNKCYKNHFQPN